MAITRERLYELMEENKSIYFVDIHKNVIEIKKEGIPDHVGSHGIPGQLYFETREEAEFVSRFHRSKILCFKPPTWEKFLETKTPIECAYWCCQNLDITMVETINCFLVGDENMCCVLERFYYTDDNKKEKYYEALEYMKKIFLETK